MAATPKAFVSVTTPKGVLPANSPHNIAVSSKGNSERFGVGSTDKMTPLEVGSYSVTANCEPGGKSFEINPAGLSLSGEGVANALPIYLNKTMTTKEPFNMAIALIYGGVSGQAGDKAGAETDEGHYASLYLANCRCTSLNIDLTSPKLPWFATILPEGMRYSAYDAGDGVSVEYDFSNPSVKDDALGTPWKRGLRSA